MIASNSSLRILFAGTPEFALPPLKALLDRGEEVGAVLTQPDRRAGRGKQLRASPVKQFACEHGLDVLQPATLADADVQQTLAALEPDLMIVVAYGLMVPDQLLALPRLGCWNIHASLLPRWRGAAPIQRAIEAGDKHTGVCIMQMETSLDTGPLFHRLETPIALADNAGTLHDRLAEMGSKALQYCLDLVHRGELPAPRAQEDSGAVYARKLSKADAELDWNQPAELLARQIRAFNPWPVSWCDINNQRLRIWRAEVIDHIPGSVPRQVFMDGVQSLKISTIDQAIQVLEIQRAGGRRMAVAEFLNAHGNLLL